MCLFNLKIKRGFEIKGRNFNGRVDVGSHTNTQLNGEGAEDQNVIHILTAGASSERMK